MHPIRFAAAGALAVLALSLTAGALAGDARPVDARKALANRRAEIVKGGDTADLAKQHYLVGVYARENGFAAEARKEFEAALSADPDHEGANEALGRVRAGEEWISSEEAMQRKGMVLRGGRWLLREEAEILDLPAKLKALRKEQQAKVNQLLKLYGSGGDRARRFAEESLGTIGDQYKVEPFAYALRSRNEALRLLAAAELGRLQNRRALRPLLHRAIHDPSEDVRHAAMAAATSIGDANLIAPLVKALGSDNAVVRMNAADAIGRSSDVRGVRYLVYKFEAHGGGSPRVYSMFANQLTFIQDFDVEVAQTAFIADPIVGVIQEGIVLDATVVATEQVRYFVEREVIHGALRRLTRATDVENEPGAWAAWFHEHGAELTAAR